MSHAGILECFTTKPVQQLEKIVSFATKHLSKVLRKLVFLFANISNLKVFDFCCVSFLAGKEKHC